MNEAKNLKGLSCPRCGKETWEHYSHIDQFNPIRKWVDTYVCTSCLKCYIQVNYSDEFLVSIKQSEEINQ